MRLLLIYISLFISGDLLCAKHEADPGSVFWIEARKEYSHLCLKYELKQNDLFRRHEVLLKSLKEQDSELSCVDLYALLNVRDQIDVLSKQKEIELACFRYKKGIEILKMVYEKILSLDHHFSSITAFQDIISMSNPNAYPEFVEMKERLKDNTNGKKKISLPEVLDNNTMFSMGYTLLYSFFGDNDKKERKEDLDRIACLLDFTLSMYSDLKIIYYETDYLKLQNEELKHTCLILFDNYTRILDYKRSLEHCRSNDEWDIVYGHLDKMKSELITGIAAEASLSISHEHNADFSHLKFGIDLLLDFINNYDHFVNMGDMHYKKFMTIIENYENKDGCSSNLPEHYNNLKKEIAYSIEKFNSAYNIAELKGSKLKDLLYGIP